MHALLPSPPPFALAPALALTERARRAPLRHVDLTLGEQKVALELVQVGWFYRVHGSQKQVYAVHPEAPDSLDGVLLWLLREIARRDAILEPLTRSGPRAAGVLRSGSVENDLAHLLTRLKEAYPGTVPRQRLLRWRKKAALDPLLNRLIDEKKVELVREETAGRPKRLYRAVLGGAPLVESSSASLEEDASTQAGDGQDSGWGESRRPPERDVGDAPTIATLFGKESS